MRIITHQEARRFYDRFGARQDAQSFYEDKAVEALIRHADFEHAGAVLEFGCGTGRLAERLLKHILPPNAKYQGLDISSTMVELANQRLRPMAGRSQVTRTEGDVQLPFADQQFDRFLSTYVLDLLTEQEIDAVIAQAHRVLKTGGRLALASLSYGENLVSAGVTRLWTLIHHINPNWVGGCRPLGLEHFFNMEHFEAPVWEIMYREKISQYGITSEVLVAKKIAAD
jgi:ubiquinone/menaquinone biosynthesis C-methylase UbiE